LSTVLIVGGARGIGLATVRALRAAGYDLIVWDRDAAALAALGAGIRTMRVDIAHRRTVGEALAMIRVQQGQLHAVVVVAGLHATYPGELMPDEVLEGVLDINFLAHARLVREAIPLLAPAGRIVGVSSIAATIGIPMSSAYSASKAALEKFYESLVAELRDRKITPVIIQPGNVKTGFNETGNTFADGSNPLLAANYRAVVERIHSRHGMPPEDVAAVICRAVAAKNPRFFYVVGCNAWRAYLATRLLGRNGALLLLMRYFGFK
jgi:NAD(P)-dependent dehydrogenase (short-subunit alcohol dehydrogenase family)